MNTVYILVAFYTSTLSINPITLQKVTEAHLEVVAFQSADRCLKNREANEALLLKKKYEDVSVECLKRDVIFDEAKKGSK